MNVYVADITKLCEEELLDKYFEKLPQTCRSRAERLKDVHKKAASVGAYSLLLSGLKDMGIESYPDIIFGKNGKPYFKDGNIFFSVSHSGEFAACAIDNCEVGIDIEKVRSVNERVLSRYFSESHADKINYAPCGKEEAFISAWVLKESLIKAKGETLAEEISKNEIESLRGKNKFTACNGKYFLKLLNDIPRYKISVCCKGQEQDIVLKKMML